MSMKNLERAHYLLQKGILFTGKKRIKGAELLYSDAVSDPYWNYATSVNVRTITKGNMLEAIISFYSERKALPALYIASGDNRIGRALARYGFKAKYADSWMVYTGRKIRDNNSGVVVKKVSNKGEMRHFTRIFETVYGLKGTGPYKSLEKGYGKALFGAFGHKQKGKSVAFYLAYLGGKPVGCAMLVTSGRYAGLYGLGVLQRYRGRGIARALTARRIADARQMGANIIFLQTEKGSINEKIFKKMGFKTELIGRCFVRPY
ncbi:MAG: GNAT family N-acetyltransferase [Candidatus Micrarchaeota archaeon]|nr:GNAT family N-acetyltransferase [Candidatus Micrarchaeota archaeon]